MAAPLDPVACGLPHREPFMFIDSVVEQEAGLSAVCTRYFAASEPFFRGHFPGHPLVPGVLLAEGAAQTAGIAAAGAASYQLSAIRQMKFMRPVPPESLVEFRAIKTGGLGGLLQFQVSAKVNGETVAEGTIILNKA